MNLSKTPWRCVLRDDGQAYLVQDADGRLLAFVFPDHSLAKSPRGEDFQTAADNGQLMAAAPTLLEACKDAKDLLYAVTHGALFPDDVFALMRKTHAKVLAAIAQTSKEPR